MKLPAPLIDALLVRNGPVPVPYRGPELLELPLLNKDAAFSPEERDALGLRGLLPPRVATIDEQLALELEHVRRKTDDLERYIGLTALQDRNETLFYRLLADNLEEFLPVVYTPTVGRACQEFSHILRRTRGLWITPDDVDRIPQMLLNAGHPGIRLVVATDNERILGLGDQGAGGMAIPIGKLALYTAAAGIAPGLTLPISLDVGTDRAALLEDPLYVGWRHPRLRGPAYDAVVEAFVEAVRTTLPGAILQWEDFKQHNASRLLARYRERLPSFNDDIQGTGAVALAGILSALRVSGRRLVDERVVLVGAGAAGIGIASMLAAAMRRSGADEARIRRALVLIDSHGLVTAARPVLDEDKAPFALPPEVAAAFGFADRPDGVGVGLAEVIEAVRPGILVGTSGVCGAFGEAAVRAMAGNVSTPIILPLSNPTAMCEAVPADLLAWTDGRALVASGSPFLPVDLPDGRRRLIGQSNNVYVFPGVGLGAIVAEAATIPDEAFLAAAVRIAALTGPERLAAGAIYPPISELRSVSRQIAIEVVRVIRDAGLSGRRPALADAAIPAAVDAAMWTPEYRPYAAG
ncbi:MAG TPA: NAD-dependent malic enzyme [Candidatus Limnocylindrales bacterium]|nr:NAD-dependent malic enzyme [Candidatus Limnocylindrales bacterium]